MKKNTNKKSIPLEKFVPDVSMTVLQAPDRPGKKTIAKEMIRVQVGKGAPKWLDAIGLLKSLSGFISAWIATHDISPTRISLVARRAAKPKAGKPDPTPTVPVEELVRRLNAKSITQIRKLRAKGLSIKEIAKRIHKSDRFVSRIVNSK